MKSLFSKYPARDKDSNPGALGAVRKEGDEDSSAADEEKSEGMEMLQKLGSSLEEILKNVPAGLRNFMPQLQAIEGFAQLISSFTQKGVHENGNLPDGTTVTPPAVMDQSRELQVAAGGPAPGQ